MRRSRTRWLVVVAGLSLLAAVAVRLDLAPWLRGPAPYPPEWQWRYRPHALSRALPAVPFALALVGLLAWSGTAAARRRPRRSAAVLLAGGAALGLAFPLALLTSEDGGAVAHLVSRTASPAYFSYHAVACSPVSKDVREFLARYAELLPALPLHAATHPPGPVLLFRGLAALLERSPTLEAPLRSLIDAACDTPGRGCSVAALAVTPVERSAALAGALAAHAAAIAALFPIAWLAFQLTRDRLAAARVAALWGLVPGTALFLPAIDPALALPVILALAGLRLALCGETERSRLAGAVTAGAATAVAAFFSYGSTAMIALGSVAVLASLPPWAFRVREAIRAGAVALLAAAALTAVPMAFGYDLVRSTETALAIHEEAYTAGRAYDVWLAFGPLDFVVFLGLPVALSLGFHLAQALRRAGRTPPARLTLGFAAAFVVLTLSGTVRGEVGRLLTPWMGLALLAGMLRLQDEPGPDATTSSWVAGLLALFDVVLRTSWRI